MLESKGFARVPILWPSAVAATPLAAVSAHRRARGESAVDTTEWALAFELRGSPLARSRFRASPPSPPPVLRAWRSGLNEREQNQRELLRRLSASRHNESRVRLEAGSSLCARMKLLVAHSAAPNPSFNRTRAGVVSSSWRWCARRLTLR